MHIKCVRRNISYVHRKRFLTRRVSFGVCHDGLERWLWFCWEALAEHWSAGTYSLSSPSCMMCPSLERWLQIDKPLRARKHNELTIFRKAAQFSCCCWRLLREECCYGCTFLPLYDMVHRVCDAHFSHAFWICEVPSDSTLWRDFKPFISNALAHSKQKT